MSRANLEWEATRTRTSTGPPGPGASLRARIAEEIARARSRPLRPAVLRALTCSLAAAVLAAILWALASPNPAWVLTAASTATVVGCILTVGTQVTTRFGYDPATRDLRHQARQETRTAARLQALESAGWVLLHDRLVVAHRVPHILVDPGSCWSTLNTLGSTPPCATTCAAPELRRTPCWPSRWRCRWWCGPAPCRTSVPPHRSHRFSPPRPHRTQPPGHARNSRHDSGIAPPWTRGR